METATSAGRERPVLDAEAALRFLAEASSVLGGSLNYEETVQRVANLLVPRIADWAGIDILEDDGTTRQITTRLEEPELQAFLLDLRERYRREPDQSQGTQAALRDNRSILIRDASGPPMTALGPADRQLYERLGIRSYMIVPLIARSRTLGAITLISRREDRRYASVDLAFAEHLARRFALAIDNARLYDEAERSLALLDTLFATAPVGLAFFDHELRYTRINDALASINGLSVAEHLGRSLPEVLPEADAEMVEQIRHVFETGEPLTDLEIQVATLRNPGQPRLFNASYYPVRGGEGEVIGVGAVVNDITERQRAQIELAQALEREREARAAAEAAERNASFLAEASALLDASLDYETTLQNVARLIVSRMADWCAVDIVEPSGGFRSVAVAHVDPAKVEWARQIAERYPPDPNAETGVPNVIRTGRAELYAEIPWEMLEQAAQDEEHLELLRQLKFQSAMLVPMVARGRTLGTITIVAAESGRHYDESELALAEELARRAAMAVDNARLYTELSGIADTLQAELLPTEIPNIPGVDVAVRYRAAGELNRVGGDFYDVFGRGLNEWAVVIGDVSGKGAPAAAVTALARYTLRTATVSAPTPSAALDALNEALLERRRDQEFCSVALAFVTLREDGLDVKLSLGGHPPALIKRASGEIVRCGSAGLLMGFVHDPPLADDDLRLGPGDTLLLYTDGVTDAAHDGDRFGDERLSGLVGELSADLPASEMTETIEHTAVAHANFQPQDDMALVAVQVPREFVRAAQFDVGGGPEAIGRARAALSEFLAGAVEEERLYDMQLLVSEVVTNAVRHGGARQGEHVDFRVALTRDQVRLEVRDPGPGFHDVTPELPASDKGGGYGLYLVDLFADDWGVSGVEGTCVWFELPLAGQPAGAGAG
ncbi:MAG TPA: SpoIIE family protein phosphatase [Thermoleophilaceae bacterium]